MGDVASARQRKGLSSGREPRYAPLSITQTRPTDRTPDCSTGETQPAWIQNEFGREGTDISTAWHLIFPHSRLIQPFCFMPVHHQTSYAFSACIIQQQKTSARRNFSFSSIPLYRMFIVFVYSRFCFSIFLSQNTFHICQHPDLQHSTARGLFIFFFFSSSFFISSFPLSHVYAFFGTENNKQQTPTSSLSRGAEPEFGFFLMRWGGFIFYWKGRLEERKKRLSRNRILF